MSVSHTLAELATIATADIRGDATKTFTGVGTIVDAESHQITFLANPGYRKHLAETRAGAVIARAEDVEGVAIDALVSDNPYAAYARVAAAFVPNHAVSGQIHASAVIDPGATIDPSASIGPLCTVGAGARIGARSRISSGAVIENDVTVGDDCTIHARVVLCREVRLGNRVVVHPGAVIGADGFGLAHDQGRWVKVPQMGSVVIGDDCEIGANTTIDRGALGDTVLEEDVRLDNQIQIAHNVVIGAHTAMAGCSAVAGSAKIGRYCLIGGGAGILGHLEVADRVTLTAMSLVTRSITEPGEYSSGSPLQNNRDWRKNAARFRQLDQLARRVAHLEKNKK